jgi:hypothetical protein
MGILDTPYCPNAECDQEAVRNAEICPKCGAHILKFGIKDATELIQQKKFRRRVKQGFQEILVSDEMTDEAIRQKISQDMMNLAMHEAGTGWMRLGTLLSGNSTDQILGAGLKALIDQNKILIRQNELLLRALKKQ